MFDILLIHLVFNEGRQNTQFNWITCFREQVDEFIAQRKPLLLQ